MNRILTFALSAMLVLGLCSCGKTTSRHGDKIVEVQKTDAEMGVEGGMTFNFKELNHKRSGAVHHTFVVHNTGTEPLVLNQVEIGCSCVEASFTKTPIAPGKTGEVTVDFYPSKVNTGSVRRILYVHSNAKNSPYPLEILAEVYDR